MKFRPTRRAYSKRSFTSARIGFASGYWCACIALTLISGFLDIQASERQTAEEGKACHAGLNIILISLDTLRADHLGLYGYERDTSPNLDRFAATSTVFEAAYTSYRLRTLWAER